MNLRSLAIAVVVSAVAVTAAVAQHADTVAQGTAFPIRFLQPITSGKDKAGERLVVQTLGAVVHDSCVVVPAYNEVVGRVTVSQPGTRFGHGGKLALQFDSLRVALDHWLPITARLDSLEYVSPSSGVDTGTIRAPSDRRAHMEESTVLALTAVTGVGLIPAAILGPLNLARRGPSVHIVAGEVGRLVLTQPLVLQVRGPCFRVTAHRRLFEAPPLPALIARTETKQGKAVGDPINVILEGSTEEVVGAFEAAGWAAPHSPTLKALSQEAVAAIAGRPGGAAPISTQYFEGRSQDLSYELPGLTARSRHHLRLWLVDTARGIWAGAANQDIGLLFKPLRKPTHRIAPDIDVERDFIVRELEAGGCADLLDYITTPDIPKTGHNAAGQLFRTDGRAAVIRARPCTAPEARNRELPGTAPSG